MDQQPVNVEPKWFLESTIIKKSLMLIYPTVDSALSVFNIHILPAKYEGIADLISLLFIAYVGVTLIIDRVKASKNLKDPTVLAPITFSKPN